MKKGNTYKFLYSISILLIVGFAIRLGADYFKYDAMLTSAPFYVYIITRALEFLLPSAIIFVVAKVLKNRKERKNDFLK